MAEHTAASRMKALLSKFEEKKEQPPPPPRKERFQSGLDAPRPELSAAAEKARRASVTRVGAAPPPAEPARRYVPQIGPTDTDEERELKRQIQAKEQEILDVASKFAAIADRLDRLVDTFHASVIGTAAVVPEAAPSADRTKAFDAAVAAADAADADADNTAVKKGGNGAAVRKSAPATGTGTSLEAILAAARSGTARVKSEAPKYSKLLRDMK